MVSCEASTKLEETMDITTAIAAHRAARAIRIKMDAEDVPDGPEYDAARDAEDEAMRVLREVRCTKDQLVEKLAYIYECDKRDAGEPPWAGENYGSVALAVQAFLEQQAA
jgi:hypothetical protein